MFIREKAIYVVTPQADFKVSFTLDSAHKKLSLGKQIFFEDKIVSKNLKYTVYKHNNVLTIQSENGDTIIQTSKVTVMKVFTYRNQDFLAFGCINSLVGIVNMTIREQNPTYINVHSNTIKTILFDNYANRLLIGDDNGLISCYSPKGFTRQWHIQLVKEKQISINDLLVHKQYIYVSTPTTLYCLTYKGEIISTLQFSSRILSHSFIPHTICAITPNNDITFVSTTSLSCLPNEISIPMLEKEFIVSCQLYNQSLYVLTKSGKLVYFTKDFQL